MTDEERAWPVPVTSRRDRPQPSPWAINWSGAVRRAHGRLGWPGCACNPTPCYCFRAAACAPDSAAVAGRGRLTRPGSRAAAGRYATASSTAQAKASLQSATLLARHDRLRQDPCWRTSPKHWIWKGGACHRGSFGATAGWATGNIDFENRLAIRAAFSVVTGGHCLSWRDEPSHRSLRLPLQPYEAMCWAPWWWWRCRREARAEQIRNRLRAGSRLRYLSSMGQMQAGRCLPATSPTPWPGSSADSVTRIIANSMGCCRPLLRNRPRAGTPAPIWSGSGCCCSLL